MRGKDRKKPSAQALALFQNGSAHERFKDGVRPLRRSSSCDDEARPLVEQSPATDRYLYDRMNSGRIFNRRDTEDAEKNQYFYLTAKAQRTQRGILQNQNLRALCELCGFKNS